MKPSLTKIHVVSHTHWDREWYQDFQGFRKRLVYLIDELLDVMENDPEYRYFMMDGHTILVDDYLEIRPENKDRLLALIQAGRISVGPWYVMPDEFLVSGESLIRNLLAGFRRARSWGAEPLKSGYVSDIFGHNSQLPQLLRGFGIDNAVLFRGFKGKDQASELQWEGADGSVVFALKLDEDRSYGDFYFFFRWPFASSGFQYDSEKLKERALEMRSYKSARGTTGLGLGLDGVDHVEVEPQLPNLIRTLNGLPDVGVSFEHSTLERYLDELRPKLGELELLVGEQRSPGQAGLNNMVLANVLSSRIPLKQANWKAEKLLETWAEPWSVFTRLKSGKAYPARFLEKSWEFLLQNHPHDSICGCSIRQVHKDMEYRFDQSRLLSEGIIREQLRFISNHIDASALTGERIVTAFNPSRFERSGVIALEFFLPADAKTGLPGPTVGADGFRIYGENGEELPYQLLDVKKNATHTWRPYRDIPYAEAADWYRVAVSASVPSFGYRTFGIRTISSKPPGAGEYAGYALAVPVRNPGTMRVDGRSWDNGRVRLTVHGDGSVTVLDHATGAAFSGLHRFEDDGDVGEGWNRAAPALDSVYTSLGGNAGISIRSDGPLVTIIAVNLGLRVPVGAVPGGLQRSAESTELAIETLIELRKDDPVVHFRTKVANAARDHRLSLKFPTGREADHYYTSTPFDLVKRPLGRPDYRDYLETASEVVPHNGIVAVHDDKAGLAILSKGLYEAAMSEDQDVTASLTLYRSTHKEVLSDGDDSGQLLQELTFEYAVYPYSPGDAFAEKLWKGWQSYVQEPRTVDRDRCKVVREDPFHYAGSFLATASFLTVEGSDGVQVSAVKAGEDREERVIVRLFNATDTEKSCKLEFHQTIDAAYRVDLDERRFEQIRVDGTSISASIGGKKLETIELSFSSREEEVILCNP